MELSLSFIEANTIIWQAPIHLRTCHFSNCSGHECYIRPKQIQSLECERAEKHRNMLTCSRQQQEVQYAPCSPFVLHYNLCSKSHTLGAGSERSSPSSDCLSYKVICSSRSSFVKTTTLRKDRFLCLNVIHTGHILQVGKSGVIVNRISSRAAVILSLLSFIILSN